MFIRNLFKSNNKKIRNHFFSGLAFNSKLCKKNFIFFAIKGNNHDGHNYIRKAIKNGARTIIHQKSFEGFKNFSNPRAYYKDVSFKLDKFFDAVRPPYKGDIEKVLKQLMK